jgi:hypothetical protein
LSVLVFNLYWSSCKPIPWRVHDHPLCHHVFVQVD